MRERVSVREERITNNEIIAKTKKKKIKKTNKKRINQETVSA